MERSWWWKAALFGAAIVLAVLYLVPTVVPEENRPAFFQKYFKKRIQLGLDLKGGLHLVYEVNIEKAVSGKVDRLANDLEDALKKKGADFTVVRSGRDDIAITFKVPGEIAKLDDELLKPYRRDMDVVSRDAASGTVKLKYDSDRVAEVEDLALRQAIETIRGRVDAFGVAEPTIIKKGTDIVVELPGAKSQDFERIKSIIGRTAQLEFKIVDDGSEYMKKVAASVAKDSAIAVVPESWTEKHQGTQHEDVYLRAKEKDKDELTKFIAGLTGDLAIPNDREIALELMSPRDVSEGTPDKYYRTYLLKKRAGVTGEYLANADESCERPESLPTRRAGGDCRRDCQEATSLARRAMACSSSASRAAPGIWALAACCVGSKRPPTGMEVCSSSSRRSSAVS